VKENILEYAVNTFSVMQCADEIFDYMRSDQSLNRSAWIACFNPHSYTVALNDDTFSKALKDADWLVADGVGVVIASKLLGGDIRERVTGSDIFSALHERINEAGKMSVFFMGSTESTLEKIRSKMNKEYPNIVVAGVYSPPFKPHYSESEVDEMICEINKAKPDLLWVGMTAPKQEKWIYQNRKRLNVKCIGAVGAVFDFYTGQVKRSNPIFQKLGLEWLPRLVQQPRRLWKRMFVSAPIFIFHTLRVWVAIKLNSH